MGIALGEDVGIHRVGGADVPNLRLSPLDATAVPPGISVLMGGTPQDAADLMRQTFASRKWKRRAATVGTATVRAIRAAGFDVIPLPTTALPNHARVIHPTGIAGFTDEPLAELSRAFATTTGC